ncbi:SagB-type dehydrogenase domain-containing protein [Micromonospora citrea]|uniref:SagB-type dehydrogenase domain-containing protein n=1 Tax=Micromonospora citrea TaxID=47855 RepID=A0A1C6TSR4_9ACTN|nr:SagB family peptide dehydrogenase [Micromonospora citrea]SCL44842.1 SagB-type dehydrogenase domain-containing protein [Micromonospora citrea]
MTELVATAALTEHHALVPGVYTVVDQNDRLRLVAGSRAETFGAVQTWKRDLLRRLAAGPCPARDLTARDDAAAFLTALGAGGWLETEVGRAQGPLYTVQPTRRPVPASSPTPDELILSRFAIVHRERDSRNLVVESPLAWARVQLHDPALLGLLTARAPAAVGAARAPRCLADRFLRDLYRCGLAVPVGGAEEDTFHLRQWSAHELWFHQRSRIGHRDRLGSGYGRTRWAEGLFEPLPARHDPYPGAAIALPTPDLERLRRTDPPLAAVMEDRRSIRVHDDDAPITLEQLGEFLYRCARMRTGSGPERAGRPYPSGGSVYELELYPVVRLASGLPAGVYHYDGHDHALRLVQGPGPGMARLVATARRGTFERLAPQVLIVVAARFGRLAWTYEQMPYSLVLKHVGVLYQTMYLAATVMGLAACGLGGGDREALNEVTGVGYTDESAVGEFLLGSRPAPQ